MSYSPIIPVSGLAGWQFLQRTQARQQEIFNNSSVIKRDIEYFRANIDKVKTAQDLISDRRLLGVALGAYGLADEINKKAFVRKILDEGVFDPDSFANRLANPNYIEFAKMFSFADGGFFPTSGRIDEIIDNYKKNSFEIAIGEVDSSMRLALNFKTEMKDLAEQGLAQKTGWLRVLGSKPLRAVVEKVFNLPSSFSQIDLDQQTRVLMEKSAKIFGSKKIDVFADKKNIDKAIQSFLLREQIENGVNNNLKQSAALSLLTGSFGANSIMNLLLSNS